MTIAPHRPWCGAILVLAGEIPFYPIECFNMFQHLSRLLDLNLKQSTREDGSQFFALHEDAPDWMREALFACHDDEHPNDWRFSTVKQLAESLSQYAYAEEAREHTAELADDMSTMSHYQLFMWYADCPSRASYVDQYKGDFGTEASEDVMSDLSLGYWYAIEQMLGILINHIEDQLEA